MKLTIDRDDLVRGLTAVQAVIERKAIQPIFAHVLLDAVGSAGLRVSGTNTETAYYGGLKAKVSKPGALAVDAAHLLQVVRSMPTGDITLADAKGNRLQVSAGRTEFKLPGLPAEEFPARAEFDAKEQATFSEPDLRRVIDQVAFAVYPDDLRYGMNGMHAEVAEGRFRAVGVDGHRMSIAECEFEGALGLPKNTLIPRKALSIIRKLLTGEGKVILSFGGTSMQVAREGVDEVFWFRLIDGEFPDYRQVIPGKATTTVEIPTAALAASLSRVGIVAEGSVRAVRFSFDKDGLELALNTERGEVEERVQASLKGKPIVVGFNAHYVAEAAAAARGDSVIVEMTTPLSPVALKDPENDTTLFVVMPLRLE